MKPPRWFVEFLAWIVGTIGSALALSLLLHALGVHP